MRTLVVSLTALVAILAGLNLYQWRWAPPPEPSDVEVIERFYDLWVDLRAPTVWQNKWFGIKTLQNPMDVWITQEIIWEIRPDFIVEAGTYHGGSALLWATILEQVNPEGRIITIDVEDLAGKAKKHPLWDEKVDFVLGSSTDPKVVDYVAREVQGGTVLVILDSLHTREHVLAELEAYGPLVTEGSYMIVQDTFVNGHPAMPDYGPGPYEAVQAFLPTAPEFEPDRTRERLVLTFCPMGFLHKVR